MSISNQDAVVATTDNAATSIASNGSRGCAVSDKSAITCQIGIASRAGRKSENQDTVLAQSLYLQPIGSNLLQRPCVLVGVADGVSVCHDPKQASRLAVEQFSTQLCRYLYDHIKSTDSPLVDELETPASPRQLTIDLDDLFAESIAHAMQSANDRLYFSDSGTTTSTHAAHLPHMLSTLSGMLMVNQRAHLFHTGDSRIYRYRLSTNGGGMLEQMSQDHRHHKGRDKGALTAALGAGAVVDLQYQSQDLRENDIWLIMTDGVYEHVGDTEMSVLLNGVVEALLGGVGSTTKTDKQSPALLREIEARLQAVPVKLCQSAYENGSRDNLSCVAVLIHAPSSQPATKVSVVAPSDTDLVRSSLPRGMQIPNALTVGQHFEGFKILQVLHHTARSSVYVVQNMQGERYVLKAPSPYFEDDGDFLRLFLKEEKIGLRFNHDSLLRFYSKPANSTYLYHLTEYIEGMSLRVYLEQHAPLDLTQTREMISRIGLALRVMHRNYLLHQDIKPENVIITENHAIKLIDFGSVGSLILKHALTPPAGDLNYTAPEYYGDAPKGVHSEVFSLGVMAYEMLTGVLPFSTKAIAAAGKHGDRLEFASVRNARPNLPYWLNDVLLRAMHADPRSRYVSIGEFVSELDPATHRGEGHHPPLLVRHPIRVWQGISAVLALSLFTSLIWQFW